MLFSTAAAQFDISINSTQGLQFLCILSYTCYLLGFFFSFLLIITILMDTINWAFSFSDYIFHFRSSVSFFQTFIWFYWILLKMVICYAGCGVYLKFLPICFSCLFDNLFHWCIILLHWVAFDDDDDELLIFLRLIPVGIWHSSWRSVPPGRTSLYWPALEGTPNVGLLQI